MSKFISSLIDDAAKKAASDLHLEPGLPAALRIRGDLIVSGPPIAGNDLLVAAQQIAGAELWETFYERRSIDLSRTVAQRRCRINIFQTFRGVGFAIRILASQSPSLHSLNLHPSLAKLSTFKHGLVLLCGPTGSGKSSTIAALVREINMNAARHIITIEQPIEYEIFPSRSFIRQREIGRDSPSFFQAILDALREDPDVIVVGEMRKPETMKLTLSAAETGHLVFSTVHSATVTEALHRIIGSFPLEAHANVCAQLADCLVAVVCQRLVWNEQARARVPECEVLYGNAAVKSCIRQNNLYRLSSIIETNAAEGMWNLTRYRNWLREKNDFARLVNVASQPTARKQPVQRTPVPPKATSSQHVARKQKRPKPQADGVLELDDNFEDPKEIIAKYLRQSSKNKN